MVPRNCSQGVVARHVNKPRCIELARIHVDVEEADLLTVCIKLDASNYAIAIVSSRGKGDIEWSVVD